MGKILIYTLLLIVTCGFTPPDQKLKAIENLPLQLSVNKGINSKLVIYLTGDGGRNNFSHKLTQELENKGLALCHSIPESIFGMKEDLKLKNTLIKKKTLTIIELPGSHQYKNDTALLVKTMDL